MLGYISTSQTFIAILNNSGGYYSLETVSAFSREELVYQGNISTKHVPYGYQYADIFPKHVFINLSDYFQSFGGIDNLMFLC